MKELLKDQTDLWSDSHVAKSVPHNFPAKALSFLLTLVCFRSSDRPSSVALTAKIHFHNRLRAPIHGQRHHCTSMPVPSPDDQTPTISQNIPERWATQLQIPDGCSCKLNMSSASHGAFEGYFILMNDILVLRKKHCTGKFRLY